MTVADPGVATTSPLVSCLMVTRDRSRLARRAIECFLSQTWANKELVVVDDGHEDYTPVLASHRTRHPITYERLPPDPGRTLGAARNVSLELARGDYCVQWDDDEWYHPARLAVQMAAIADGADAVVLKYTLMHLDTPDYIAHPYRCSLRGGTPGTILHRRSNVRYPELRKNEDAIYLDRHRAAGRVATLGSAQSHLFIRCFHGENTWNREHFLRRLHTTKLDKLRHFVAVRLRRDLFSHPAFQLATREREAFEHYLSQSRAVGLLSS
jgi:glycosyltransferase involved in cell wall biosynthesis